MSRRHRLTVSDVQWCLRRGISVINSPSRRLAKAPTVLPGADTGETVASNTPAAAAPTAACQFPGCSEHASHEVQVRTEWLPCCVKHASGCQVIRLIGAAAKMGLRYSR